MNRWQQAFCLLLQAGLWEKRPTSLSLFPLTDYEWQQVYHESRRQAIQGLLYRGFQLLPEYYFPPQQVLLLWLTDIIAIEENNQQMLQAVMTSQQLLHRAGMKCVLQKGLSVAAHYEHPQQRSCGDIDWYVATDGSNWKALLPFLHEQGFSPTVSADGSIFFLCDDVQVELHRRLIDIQNPKKKGLLTELSAESALTTQKLSDCVSVTTPSPVTTMVMLMAHMMKHALTVGIGLRQFCDLARAYHAFQGQYDPERLSDCYRQLGMTKWCSAVHALLTDYLGVPAELLPSPTPATRDGEKLMERVARWGNFGQHTSQWPGHPSKRYTVGQIVRNLPMSIHFAPMESFYNIRELICGQRRYLANPFKQRLLHVKRQ